MFVETNPVRDHPHALDTFTSNYSAHEHVRGEGKVCLLQMFQSAAYIYLSFWITEMKRTHLKWYVYSVESRNLQP